MTRIVLFLSALFSVFAVSGGDVKSNSSLPELTANQEKLMESIGAKLDADKNIVIGKAKIDRRTGTVSFPARTNIRYGTIEVLIAGEKGRNHESLLITELDPFHLQLALILAGYDNGPMLEGTKLPQGAKFDIMLTTPDKKTVKADSWLLNAKLETPKADDGYVFVGSIFQGSTCVASVEDNLVNINSGDTSTILNAVLTRENVYDEYAADGEKIYGYVKPPEGEVPGEVAPVDVVVSLVPRAKTNAVKKPEAKAAASVVPRSAEAIEKSIDSVAFTAREIQWDFDKLLPVLNLGLVPGDKKASLRIIDAKLKLMEKFFSIYEKTHETNDCLIKAKNIYLKTKELRTIYSDSSK